MTEPASCPRCREAHEVIACPHLKAIEFEDGHDFESPSRPLIRRLEFLTPADYVAAPRSAADGAPLPDYPRKPSR